VHPSQGHHDHRERATWQARGLLTSTDAVRGGRAPSASRALAAALSERHGMSAAPALLKPDGLPRTQRKCFYCGA
jgi:hypothetical protein